MGFKMNTLIVGRGVVGTIYGWALSQAGVEITHVVRKGRRAQFDREVEMDVLDLREGHTESQRTVYLPKVVEEVSPHDGYELVIVATKQYQAAEAVGEFKDRAPSATFLMFTANWEGPQAIDALLPRSRYLWGYAAASGGYLDNLLIANMRDDVRLGELDGSHTPRLEAIIKLFGKADIRADLKPDIIEWLWIHHAINAGTVGTALYAGGLEELGNPGMLNHMVYAVRDALRVTEKRGVELARWPDTTPFLETPVDVLVSQYKYMFTEDPVGKRVLKAGHFQDNPHEMRQFYLDVLHTGEQLDVPMPYLSAMKSKIESLP